MTDGSGIFFDFYFPVLLMLLAGSALLHYINTRRHNISNRDAEPTGAPDASYEQFLRKYLMMYACAISADWIQGPYLYHLYASAGLSHSDITMLYMVSFQASGIAGVFIGSLVTRVGHRLSALAFCVIFSLSALLKLSKNFTILCCSSVLGGTAITLMHTVFDSWLIKEHHSRRCHPSLLSRAFSLESSLSSLVAVASSVLGSFLADEAGGLGLGPRSPFGAAVFILCVAAALVVWTIPADSCPDSVSEPDSFRAIFRSAWKSLATLRDAKLVCITQALFESAMYMFVVLWNPVVLGRCRDTITYISSLGWIYAAFMVAMTIGSQIYAFLTSKRVHMYLIATGTFTVASAALLVATVISKMDTACAFAKNDMRIAFLAFTLFEGMCGLYYPIIKDLKAQYFPAETRTGLMSLSRVGQNIIITILLLSTRFIRTSGILFLASLCLCVVAFLQGMFSGVHDE